MTLERAIELADYLANRLTHINQADEQASIRLLAEAGKRILRQRRLTVPVHQPPLPGEDIL